MYFRQSLLEKALREIHSARDRAGADSRSRGLNLLVRSIDELLFALEDLNLRGIDRVPASLRERASTILESTLKVAPDAPEMRVRWRVVPMMDELFRAQEVLFQLLDPGRVVEEDELDTA